MKSFPYNQRVTRDDLTAQVVLTLGDFVADFDLGGIVDAIVDTYGVVHVDVVPDEDYWALVRRFDRGSGDE
jgi:hypothetical protein